MSISEDGLYNRANVNRIIRPTFQQVVETIYARPTGSDTRGDGSLLSPYASFQRAIRDVPEAIFPGRRFVFDITGLNETLPDSFELPTWSASTTHISNVGAYNLFTAPVEIIATPQLVQALSEADCLIADEDIASQDQDAVTQLITLTLTTPRASWDNNALKGKHVVDFVGGNHNAVICASTDTTLLLATTTALTGPIMIVEPGATLTGSGEDLITGSSNGAFNVRGGASVALSGIKIVTTTDEGYGFVFDGSGHCTVQMCEMMSPNISSDSQSIVRYVRNWTYGAVADFSGNITFQNGLLDGIETLSFSTEPNLSVSIRKCVVDGCSTIEPVAFVPGGGPIPVLTPVKLFDIENSLVINTPDDDAIRAHGGRWKLFRVDIYGAGGNAITCNTGTGFMELNNVRTTGTENTGLGLEVTDGMQVKVNSFTSEATEGTQLRGGDGEMKVGNLEARNWADFVSGEDDRPALCELDLGIDENDCAFGTGTRVYQ